MSNAIRCQSCNRIREIQTDTGSSRRYMGRNSCTCPNQISGVGLKTEVKYELVLKPLTEISSKDIREFCLATDPEIRRQVVNRMFTVKR